MYTRLNEYFGAMRTRAYPIDDFDSTSLNWTDGSTPFYRVSNDKTNSKYNRLDPSKHSRRPIGSSKFTGLLEYLDSWSKWPKRSKSVIMYVSDSFDVNTAKYTFGDTLYRIWPDDNSRIVISPCRDLNSNISVAFPKAYDMFGDLAYDIMQFVPGKIMSLCRRYSLYDFGSEMEVYCLDDLMKNPNKLFKAYDIAAELELDKKEEDYQALQTMIQLIREAGSANAALSKLLDPIENGFKLVDIKDIYNNLPNNSTRECWTDNPVTMEVVAKGNQSFPDETEEDFMQ